MENIPLKTGTESYLFRGMFCEIDSEKGHGSHSS